MVAPNDRGGSFIAHVFVNISQGLTNIFWPPYMEYALRMRLKDSPIGAHLLYFPLSKLLTRVGCLRKTSQIPPYLKMLELNPNMK